MRKSAGGKKMTSEELEKINLECDLIGLINKYAWPHGDRLAKELLSLYAIQPKHQRVPIHVSRD